MTFDAIYENGVLRPLVQVAFSEQQIVRVTVRQQRCQVTDPNLKALEDLIDWEYMEDCKQQLSEGPVPTLEEVQQALSKIPGSLVDDLVAEREMR